MFSNTFAGIAPASAPSYIGAQIAGGVLAVVVVKTLYPDITPHEAAGVVVPHATSAGRDGAAASAASSASRASD
jgi:arsenate reductase